MRCFGLFVFFIFTVIVFTAEVYAADNTLTRLNEFLQKKTFHASFDQKVYDEKKTLIVHSTGTVVIQRPGKFRWEYLKPSRQIIVADGKNLLNYDPELDQAVIQPMVVSMAYAPMMLLLGEAISSSNFEIDIGGHEQGLDWITLMPKVEDTEFVRIDLGLNQTQLIQLVMYDRFEQVTKIEFLNTSFGKGVKADAFRFYLPERTDILGDYSLPVEILTSPKHKPFNNNHQE